MHRLLLPLLLPPLLLGAAAPPSPDVAASAALDPGVAALSDDAEARWIPFELTPGNQIRFTLRLDGRPLEAILDTGVSYSVLARAAADPARVRLGGSATAIGGAVAVGWMPTARIEMGGLTRSGGGVGVAALPALATGGAAPVDMLVGRDLTGGHALDIDYAGRRFRILRSGRMPFAGSIAPLSISPQRRVYETTVQLGGARLAPMVVDTGDGSSMTVTRAAWVAAGLDRLPGTTAVAYGLAGAVVSDLAIVPELRLGALAVHEVEVRGEAADGFSQAIGVAGRIGTGFLGRYRVLLDPVAGRMVLSPGPTADQPPLRSTSGLLLGLAGTRLRVLHVMRGGPAAAAGWRDGELICAVDGTAVTRDYPTSPLAAWSAGPPGTRVRLTGCDGTERVLTLARFY